MSKANSALVTSANAIPTAGSIGDVIEVVDLAGNPVGAIRIRHRTGHAQNPPTHREDPLCSIGEFARQIGRHPSTVMRWAKEGLFEVVIHPGNKILVRQSVINRFLIGTTLNNAPRQLELLT